MNTIKEMLEYCSENPNGAIADFAFIGFFIFPLLFLI
jgi:hypothetical protein